MDICSARLHFFVVGEVEKGVEVQEKQNNFWFCGILCLSLPNWDIMSCIAYNQLIKIVSNE